MDWGPEPARQRFKSGPLQQIEGFGKYENLKGEQKMSEL